MFIGHFAPALVAATLKDAPKLGTLCAAAQLVDIGFFGLVLAGVESLRIVPGFTAMNPMDLHHMPYTHSLLGSAVWAAGFGILIAWATGRRAAGAIAAAVVLSHWLLDLVVHVPDLTLAGEGTRFGFGLWNHPAAAISLEIGVTCMALWWFARRSAATRPAGRWSLWGFGALLLAMQAINWFGPQPIAMDATIPLQALAAYGLVIAAAAWVTRTRAMREA